MCISPASPRKGRATFGSWTLLLGTPNMILLVDTHKKKQSGHGVRCESPKKSGRRFVFRSSYLKGYYVGVPSVAAVGRYKEDLPGSRELLNGGSILGPEIRTQRLRVCGHQIDYPDLIRPLGEVASRTHTGIILNGGIFGRRCKKFGLEKKVSFSRQMLPIWNCRTRNVHIGGQAKRQREISSLLVEHNQQTPWRSSSPSSYCNTPNPRPSPF